MNPDCPCNCHQPPGHGGLGYPQANACHDCFNHHAIIDGRSSYSWSAWSDPIPDGGHHHPIEVSGSGYSRHVVSHAHPSPVSPDILDSPDPDKDTDMTDLTVTPAPISLTIGDTTYQPRDANAVVTLLDRASADPTTTAFVQKARKAEATGTLGLYIEAVAHTAHGTPFSHMKFFIVGTHVYSYNRSAGDARANWRGRNVASLADALMLVQAAIDKPAVKILGHPVLVELTPDDVSAVESGQLPPGRFRGQYRIERDFGRYDFEMDVRTAPMPPKLVKALSRKPWVVGPV